MSVDVILYARFSKASMKTTLVDGRFLVAEFFAVLAIRSFRRGLVTVDIFIAVRYV